MNGKYKKSSQSRYVYIVIETVTVIFTTCINMLNHSILNLVVWGVLTGIIAYALYYEDMDKPLRRIIECEALVFCMSVCESLGVILLQCILQAADIKNVNETMLYCLEVTFSKVILIFLYYTFINRFVKKSDIPYAKTRYIMYGIILLYNLINMGVIVENFKNGEENYLCAVNMGCIVLADLYLLYFVKMADEKNYYEKQLIALEQIPNDRGISTKKCNGGNAMGITGVGSSYNFVYNTKTGKLSTKDGSKNEFVDFCNGDVKGEDTETLNHFDEHTRYQFTRMLFAYGTGMTGQNPFANDEKVEITADIDSATHTSFYVNGQKAFTAITGMSYLPSEIQTFGTVQQPFKTRGYKPYDPSTNSITIGVGSRFNLGNGYSMTVQEDFVWGEGYGNGSKADDERCNMMIGGLNSLIHFADQQYFSSMTDTYTDYILDFLASQGVDTSREFVINGTHCELVNGKIREVGNDYVVPSSIQQKAVKRYEESMSQLLNGGTWYRWS